LLTYKISSKGSIYFLTFVLYLQVFVGYYGAMKLTIKEKLMLLKLATISSISNACAYMNVSRDTYYRLKKAYEEVGVEALAPKYRRAPNLKNRVEVEEAVLKLSAENPEFGKKKLSRILKDRGMSISPNTVKAVLDRYV
jgi:transposase